MPYTPHEWSSSAWALMLTFMILFTLGIALAYLLLVHRSYERPSRPAAPSGDDRAIDGPVFPTQQALTPDELRHAPV